MPINVLRATAAVVTSALLVLGTGGAAASDAPDTPVEASGDTGATTGSSTGSPTVTEPVDTTADTTGKPAPKLLGADPAVGALFDGTGHFCSASVVHSAAGDLVLTAAHCVNGGSGDGYRTGLSFAPGYHDGVEPFGRWTVTGAVVADGWSSSADPDLDFAFLTVRQDGNPGTVESLTGANQLGISQGFTNQVTLTGYPDTSNSPVVCRNATTQSDAYQQRIACAGFPDGTSGGPWVTGADPSTGHGTVVGVIGGYQLGGDSPDVSYSAYFDDDIQRLYGSVNG
ncbi:trypsin-like serine peptidase [Amycolatopsis sp. H20-H5]|uniref:trypsin-like serine peptidase n=1 Tax=Amycolatopsis sp. H20-H5 TaxID=3046309 RepID=UPI002DBEEB20|nr:trypsin-like serine protease [Amycolatopsis sp. H20-H5]MEC3981945.1 trypsin-like serine protease [Amycolatopsis sp. H20-H5]